MKFVIGCAWLEWLSIIGSVVSVAVSLVAIRTSKRYASGNTRIVNEALNPERLEKAAMILSEATHWDDAGNIGLKLYLSDLNKYCALMMIFQELNSVALLVSDNALPKKVCKDTNSKIVGYLSRKQVLDFVRMNKDAFGALYGLARSEGIEA